MKIGILQVDGKNFINLALAKISHYHKLQNDNVEWYNIFEKYDIVYMSKVFSFTNDYPYSIFNSKKVIKGGTGYDLSVKLHKEIDMLQPDYNFYNIKNFSYGFTTRGCVKNCNFCIVKEKEGNIKEYMSIEEIAQNNKNVILMDNNILSCEHGINQLIKSIDLKLNIDCNQGLDKYFINSDIAKILVKIKWIKYIRLACDNINQIDKLIEVVCLLRNLKKSIRIQVYVILLNRDDSLKIIETCKKLNVFVFSQPFLDFNKKNIIIEKWQKNLSRYTNRKEIYMSCSIKDYIYKI